MRRRRKSGLLGRLLGRRRDPVSTSLTIPKSESTSAQDKETSRQGRPARIGRLKNTIDSGFERSAGSTA